MIITIFSADGSATRSILAANLATLCALHHRKVLLIDATSQKYALQWGTRREASRVRPKVVVRGAENIQSELTDLDSYYRTHYRDIIIDADGVDSWGTEAALDATDVLVIPVRSEQGDVSGEENLIQCIETLRLFSPTLRVLVVDVFALGAAGDAGKRDAHAATAFAKKILTATLADAVIYERIDDRRVFDQGHSIFECVPCNEQALTDMNSLYREILKVKELRLEKAVKGTVILKAIQRRIKAI